MRAGDLEKLKKILEAVPEIEFICLDVANGYSEHFVEFVKQVRQEFPKHTIMVSCVCFVVFIRMNVLSYVTCLMRSLRNYLVMSMILIQHGCYVCHETLLTWCSSMKSPGSESRMNA